MVIVLIRSKLILDAGSPRLGVSVPARTIRNPAHDPVRLHGLRSVIQAPVHDIPLAAAITAVFINTEAHVVQIIPVLVVMPSADRIVHIIDRPVNLNIHIDIRGTVLLQHCLKYSGISRLCDRDQCLRDLRIHTERNVHGRRRIIFVHPFDGNILRRLNIERQVAFICGKRCADTADQKDQHEQPGTYFLHDSTPPVFSSLKNKTRTHLRRCGPDIGAYGT